MSSFVRLVMSVVKDGSVLNGPAKQPLAEKKVTVNNGGTLTITDS
jgi:hypothetical protein